MKLGDLVYRVIPYDPPDGEQTWEVLERRIAQVRRDGKLVLERPFPGQAVRIVSMSSVDSDPSMAVVTFLIEQAERYQSALRACDQILRAMDWAKEAHRKLSSTHARPSR